MLLHAALRWLFLIYLTSVLSFVSTADKGDSDGAFVDYDYNSVEQDSSMKSLSRQSSSSSAAASAAEADMARQWQLGRHDGSSSGSSWRWCYVCSGKTPDRQCELFPQHVTLGPAKVNCTKNYCTAYVRYRPKDYAVERDRNGKPVVGERSLSPADYEVSSVARECVDADRGNECHVDADQLGVTCYSSCSTHYCNDETPRPTWHDFRRHRLPASDNKDNVNDNDDNNDEDILSRAAAKNDDELTLRLPPDTENRRAKPAGRDFSSLYQPADRNGVGTGNYELSNANDTTYPNSLSRPPISTSAGNSTVTSSALCRSRANGFIVNCVVALVLLTSCILKTEIP